MTSTKETDHIFISVIIPTLNEEQNIGKALQCLVDNHIPPSDMEVLLIDGGSQDRTLEHALTYADRLNLKIITSSGASVYKALNIGLNEARGEYFVRVDARSEVPSNYIKTCISHLQIPYIECAGGIQLQYGDTNISRSIARVTASFIGTGGAKFRTATESTFVDSVYLGVYKSATLRSLGGYEDRSDFVSEDSFINKRIRERGYKVFLDASLIVRYPAKSSFRALIKQYVIYGAAKAFLVRKHKKLTSPRQYLPLVALILGLVLILGALTGIIPSSVIYCVTSLYLAIILIANSGNALHRGQDPGSPLARTVATICIHFAWPIGFYLSLVSPALHKRLVAWL